MPYVARRAILSTQKTASLLHDKFRGTPAGGILPIEYFNAKRKPERLHQVIVVVGDVARIQLSFRGLSLFPFFIALVCHS